MEYFAVCTVVHFFSSSFRLIRKHGAFSENLLLKENGTQLYKQEIMWNNATRQATNRKLQLIV